MKLFKKLFAVILLAVCMTSVLAAACSDGSSNSSSSSNTTITYDTGVEGVTIPSLTAKPGSKIYPPTDPGRDGYRFEGWELDGTPFVFDTMPQNDITLKAVWAKLYLLVFETGAGATEIPSAEYAKGDTIIFPSAPTLSGHKFDGWLLNGEPFTQTVMPEGNLTLTAKWVTAYTITFITGTPDLIVPPIVEKAGEKISAPKVRRPGYYLKCWMNGSEAFTFDEMPEKNITLTAEWVKLTNLPAMFIDLTDKTGKTFPLADVTREEYISSKISLTNTDEQFELDSVAANFKGRGNGSWTDSGDKKGYKIKFDKKQSLFGRESNKHWVIIACANFDDITMSRNYMAYNMASELFTNIEYSTEAYWIDVYVNGEYRGVYLLCEHVRVGAGRVDIESDYLTDNFESTGYLVEYDAYYTGSEGVDYFKVPGLKYAFTVHSPDPEEYSEEGGVSKAVYMRQVAYIKDYITQVYTAALNKSYSAFAELVDVDSFVDMYILHELFKNVDTGYSSFYLYKKPNGKLFAGPPWDFDATTNISERGDRTPSGIYVADSVQQGFPEAASELFISLYQTSGFKSAIRTRWKVLSPSIKTFIDGRLNDTVYARYREAMGKNFALWKGKSQTAAENDWVNDVKALKQWLLDRVAWLDNEWK